MRRAVRKFSSPPDEHPLHLYLDHDPYENGPRLTHRYLLNMMTRTLKYAQPARVLEIRFEERSVIHGTSGLEDRWILRVDSSQTRRLLERTALEIHGRTVFFRPYDTILRQEYKQHLRHEKAMQKLNVAHKNDSEDNIMQA